jgi:anti-sigma B factor antagonist
VELDETEAQLDGDQDGGAAAPTNGVMGLTVDVERTGKSARVVVGGELDAYSSPRLDELVRELFEQDTREIVMNLHSTSFLDSSGLRAMLACHRRLEDIGGRLLVEDPSEPVLRLLEITGLTEHFGLEAASADEPPVDRPRPGSE